MDTLTKFRKAIMGLIERLPASKIDLLLAVAVTVSGLVVYAYVEIGKNTSAVFGFITTIEERSLDARFRMRGTRPHEERIVIVDIDEKTLQKVGAWPIPRNTYAVMLDKLSEGGAKTISFDVDFPTPEKNSAVEALKKLEEELGSRASKEVIEKIRAIEGTSDNDVILADSVKKSGRVILGHIFLDRDRAKSQDAKAAEDYFNILSNHPFPQMLKVVGGRDFDFEHAWEDKKPNEKLDYEPGGAQSNRGRVYWGVESNIRIIGEASLAQGFFNYEPDSDGTVRHTILVARYLDRDFYPSLALQTLISLEDIKQQSIEGHLSENGVESMSIGPYNLNIQKDASGLINFTGPYNTYKHYSMADVIDGTLPPSTFKDKVVFVGATALAIGDLRNTPYNGSYMGVELHANTLDNLLHTADKGRGFLHRGQTEEMIDIVLLLISGLGLGYLFSSLPPLRATIAAILGLGIFSFIVYSAFVWYGMWLCFVIPAGTMILNYAAITSFRMVFEEREKRKIRKSFSSYVSPGVIALIEKDPKKYFRTGGEMKELTIMFSDIRSFTTIAEGLTPDELVHLLNEYLGEMTDIIFKNWGTLDKYIGDAIMGFWGSPFPQADHAVRGCRAALEMGHRLDEMNMKWEAQGRKQLAIGIGLNTGPVNVGNMGSDKRLAWTVMGDHVNLSSRLEGQTKDYKIRIIAGDGTYIQAKEHFVFRDLDKIKVKGKLKPVIIYELLAYAKDAASYSDLLEKWQTAISLYRAGNWKNAADSFETMLNKYPDDGPAHTFLKRCHENILAGVPEGDWDGVWVAKSK